MSNLNSGPTQTDLGVSSDNPSLPDINLEQADQEQIINGDTAEDGISAEVDGIDDSNTPYGPTVPTSGADTRHMDDFNASQDGKTN